jgi:hypothetical protein
MPPLNTISSSTKLLKSILGNIFLNEFKVYFTSIIAPVLESKYTSQ